MSPTSVTSPGQGHRARRPLFRLCLSPGVCSLVLAHWVSRVLHGRQRQRHGQHQGDIRERDEPRDR